MKSCDKRLYNSFLSVSLFISSCARDIVLLNLFRLPFQHYNSGPPISSDDNARWITFLSPRQIRQKFQRCFKRRRFFLFNILFPLFILPILCLFILRFRRLIIILFIILILVIVNFIFFIIVVECRYWNILLQSLQHSWTSQKSRCFSSSCT